ncbi:phage minor head protein [Sphingobium sp. AN558]|uniref:phage minor head protein n=1 Tax=Sphingobium sp. AN558 TaxID=3133442 RepID=UPI0030C542A6
MSRFNLAALARRQRNIRRNAIVLRDIIPPATLATNLFRACYLPVITAWSNALPRIDAAYERSLSELTQDSPADVRGEISSAAEAINRLILLLTPDLRDWVLRAEQWYRGKWRGAVLAATGVDLSTMLGAEDVRASLETTLEWNTALIRDVSDQARQRISSAVFDGLRNRTPAREVAKTIREGVDMGRARATRIASDQLSKLTSSLAEERRREAGIDTWKWRSSHKLHYRPEHAARDGKEYTDETAPKDLPGRLPFCGCRSQAVVRFD